MKKFIVFIILFVLLFTSCASNSDTDATDIEANSETYEQPALEEAIEPETKATDENTIPEDMVSAINDWITGTEYGINKVDFYDNTFIIDITEQNKSQLAYYDFDDINNALIDLGNAFGFENCKVIFSDGSIVHNNESEKDSSTQDNSNDAIINNLSQEDTINLMFIHHSVGENWLNDGLAERLNENNVHVADTYYGWSDVGDLTDTVDWPKWFNDSVMPMVYNKLDTETTSNIIEPGNGENTIIMFKSCFPNSDVGNSIDDEIMIYDSLFVYFLRHPDKMFVLITPPPMQNISNSEKTRELTNYLTSENGWLKDYPFDNIFVYDLYNVLTHPDNHHMLVEGSEQHIVTNPSNTLYYDSDGDDHPNTDGNIKATEEFVPLLMHWYEMFID